MGADWYMMGYIDGNDLVWHAGIFWDVNDITGISINWIDDEHCDNMLGAWKWALAFWCLGKMRD